MIMIKKIEVKVKLKFKIDLEGKIIIFLLAFVAPLPKSAQF